MPDFPRDLECPLGYQVIRHPVYSWIFAFETVSESTFVLTSRSGGVVISCIQILMRLLQALRSFAMTLRYSLFAVIISIVILIPGIANADVLIYRDVVVDVLRHSPQLRMKIEDIRISHAQYRTSFAGLFPSINLSGRAERYENIDSRSQDNIQTIGNEVVGGNQSAWRSSLNLTGQYYFSHWYKKRYETKYYEELKESAIYQCDSEAKKIIREITNIYGSLVETRMKLNYSQQILLHLQEILKIKKGAHAAGQLSFEDVLKAETEVVSVEKEITGAKKELQDIFYRLSVYTGGSYSENTQLDPILFKNEMAHYDEKTAIMAAPEYKMRAKEMEAISSKTAAARNNLLPDISVYARYDLFNSSPANLNASIRDTEPTSYSVGVLVSLPLFDGGARIWEWKKNIYEIRKQEENTRATYEEKDKEIKTIRDGYNNLSKSYQHYKKLSEQYEKMKVISQKARALGERSQLDVLELEKDALAVERDIKITQHMLAVYETLMTLELDYNKFLRDYDGNWACSY